MCENEKTKSHSIEMTTGSLWKNILLFSLPLMGSQVLEVLFNLSDVAVVGRFAEDSYHGIQLCIRLLYGRQHRRIPRYWEKHSAYHYRYPGFLRISYCLDLYSICTLPDDFITVSSVYLLMGNYRPCRDSVFCCKF